MLLRCRDHGTGYAFPAGCMRWGGAGVIVRRTLVVGWGKGAVVASLVLRALRIAGTEVSLMNSGSICRICWKTVGDKI